MEPAQYVLRRLGIPMKHSSCLQGAAMRCMLSALPNTRSAPTPALCVADHWGICLVRYAKLTTSLRAMTLRFLQNTRDSMLESCVPIASLAPSLNTTRVSTNVRAVAHTIPRYWGTRDEKIRQEMLDDDMGLNAHHKISLFAPQRQPPLAARVFQLLNS